MASICEFLRDSYLLWVLELYYYIEKETKFLTIILCHTFMSI